MSGIDQRDVREPLPTFVNASQPLKQPVRKERPPVYATRSLNTDHVPNLDEFHHRSPRHYPVGESPMVTHLVHNRRKVDSAMELSQRTPRYLFSRSLTQLTRWSIGLVGMSIPGTTEAVTL